MNDQTDFSRRPLAVELPLRVNGYDVDWAGVVSNIVYVRWLEDLRQKMLDVYLPLDEMFQDGISPIVLRTDIHYRKAIVMFDQVVGRMWVEDLVKIRYRLRAEIRVGAQLSASAIQEGCFVNLEKRRPVRPPEKFLRQWKNVLATEGK